MAEIINTPFGKPGERWEAFDVVDGVLIRDVWPARGSPYCHCCDRDTFEEVLHAIDAQDGRPFTGEQLVCATGRPSTQVFTALAFLKERSILDTARRRKTVIAGIFDAYLDGMTEFTAQEAGA